MTTPTKRRKQAKRTKRPSPIPPVEQRGLAAYAPDVGAPAAEAGPTTAVLVPIDRIDVPAKVQEIPLDVENVRSIAATLRVGGLIQPIRLRPVGERFELEMGRHRMEAHKRVGLDKVLSHIARDSNETQGAVVRAVENLQRRQLGPYEEARGYQDLVDHGLSVADVAAQCGVSESTVKARLRLLALPADVGFRIGEPGFTLAHAEALLALAPYPKLLEAAKPALGQVDFDKRPLTVGGFCEAVRKELRGKRLVKDLDTWQVRELAQRYPDFKRGLAKLPTVKLTGRWKAGTLDCVDPKAYRKLAWPFQQKEKARREKEAAKPSTPRKDETDWKEQRRQRAFAQAWWDHEMAQRIRKAAKGVLGLDDRLLRLLAVQGFHDLVNQDPDREGRLLAEAVGAAQADVADAMTGEGEEGAKAREAFVDRVLANGDRLVLARFLTAATLLRAENYRSQEWSRIAADWLGVDEKDLAKRLKKAYKAWGDAGATDPLPGQAPEEEPEPSEATSPALEVQSVPAQA